MFKIDCMVNDRDLAKVMKHLAEIKVFNLSAIPVKMKETKGKTSDEISKPSQTSVKFLTDELKGMVGSGQSTVTAAHLASSAEKHGFAYSALMYGLKTFTKKGVLTRTSRGEYLIHGDKLA